MDGTSPDSLPPVDDSEFLEMTQQDPAQAKILRQSLEHLSSGLAGSALKETAREVLSGRMGLRDAAYVSAYAEQGVERSAPLAEKWASMSEKAEAARAFDAMATALSALALTMSSVVNGFSAADGFPRWAAVVTTTEPHSGKVVRITSFPYSGVDGHELFLTRCRNAGLASVAVCLAAVAFFFAEEGWHVSFLVGCVLPPIAAYLGVKGKREIRTGLSATALGLAIATLPLMFLPASLEVS